MEEYLSLEETIMAAASGRYLEEAKKKLDPVDRDELKGKHDERDDKDIDNDGDVDSSDKYLHKKRKAISKDIDKKKGGKEQIDINPKIDENKEISDGKKKTYVQTGGTDKKGRKVYISVDKTPVDEEVELSEESKTIEKVRKIVDEKQAMKIDGVTVDMFTASAITQIYDKVNDANKKKMDGLKITKLANLAMKMMKREEVELDEAKNKVDNEKVEIEEASNSGRNTEYIKAHDIAMDLTKKSNRTKKIDHIVDAIKAHKKALSLTKSNNNKSAHNGHIIDLSKKIIMAEEVELDEAKNKVDPATVKKLRLAYAKTAGMGDKAFGIVAKKTGIDIKTVRAVLESVELDEAKEPSVEDIHKVLSKTKNARDSINALKKAFKVNDAGAKNLLRKALGEEVVHTLEEEMSEKQKKKREDIVLKLKDKKEYFKQKYGDRWEDVMYATATKMAMKEGFEVTSSQFDELGQLTN